MDTYTYAAALLCEECGKAERMYIALEKPNLVPEDPADTSTYDSNDYPKGPDPDGGGEADTPQHCGNCSCFLENPLTSDGHAYAAALIIRALADFANGDADAVKRVSIVEWAPFYDLDTVRALIEAGPKDD